MPGASPRVECKRPPSQVSRSRLSAVIGSVCDKFSANGEQDPELSSLSWEAAGEMASRGRIEVICHTWEMHALSPRRGCSRQKGESETAYRSALTKDLSRFLTESAAHGLALTPAIAYPYGAYSRATVQAVEDFGFLAAFTCDEQVNHLSGAAEELLRLGRFNRPHGDAGRKIFEKMGRKQLTFPGHFCYINWAENKAGTDGIRPHPVAMRAHSGQ